MQDTAYWYPRFFVVNTVFAEHKWLLQRQRFVRMVVMRCLFDITLVYLPGLDIARVIQWMIICHVKRFYLYRHTNWKIALSLDKISWTCFNRIVKESTARSNSTSTITSAWQMLIIQKFTAFTRAQHTRILSYIPPAALKNTVMRSARPALACILMKLKLGLSNSVLASMVGITDKRQTSRIISGARIAACSTFRPASFGFGTLNTTGCHRQTYVTDH